LHVSRLVDVRGRERFSSAEAVAGLLRGSSYPVALTGAGVSTPSGIPDFRSPGSGLWERVDGLEVASASGFARDPKAFYDWIRPLAELVAEARPNAAHEALAELERRGRLRAVITQNIDGLHQEAGSKEVVELHGDAQHLVCPQCGSVVATEDRLQPFIDSGELPTCARCGSVMKPRVVLFGEQLPPRAISRALEHVRRADLMLVAGSSLSVTPASELPRLLHSQGGALVLVNREPTYADGIADCVLREDVAHALPRVVDALGTCTKD
jgi:NAD-dependent deacetylase